ncbi:hypothetical protein [Methyloglobulus sp.]|uniref:hypothetical protein n=1 Tax=Methyloglobulus sp. TaxID=2518622 RepID=UPI0032B76608
MMPDYSLSLAQIFAFFVVVIGSWMTQSKYNNTEFSDNAIFSNHLRLWCFITVILAIIMYSTIDFSYYCNMYGSFFKDYCSIHLIPIRWSYMLITLTLMPAIYQNQTAVRISGILLFYISLLALLIFGVGLIRPLDLDLILFNLNSHRFLLFAAAIILVGHVIILWFGSVELLKKIIKEGLIFFLGC